MGHRLTPTASASQRSLEDLIASLRGAFPIVDADWEKGNDHIGDMIAHFLRMREGYARWKDPPPEAAEIVPLIERLNQLRDKAAYISVAEDDFDEDRCIVFNLVPGEDIIIGYANQRHEDLASPIAIRVAEALGYTVEAL